jgi:hypothetical protein
MSNPNPNPNTNASSSRTIFRSSTEVADLGRERFDHDTAEITDRDAALFSQQPVNVRQGRAPRGLENQVFAWNTFKYTTDERDDREELKGELHEGQLHRQNRAARDSEGGGSGFAGSSRDGGRVGGGMGRGGAGGGRGGRNRNGDDGMADVLRAGMKEGEAPPLAKGIPDELDKSMFWEGPIGGSG